jgi:deferrochelatase/peroxidase EfeB
VAAGWRHRSEARGCFRAAERRAPGDLDCGLIFTADNQNPHRQFDTIQARLENEPMTDYIIPVGGGYFFAPRGSRGAGDWVGSGLEA